LVEFMDLSPVIECLRSARRVLFITGAGLSADSGLPTYRGVGGLYDRGPTDEGVPIEVMLGGRMMREDPAACWKYIGQIEEACRGAQPNAGHHAIARLEALLDEVWVLTQNVDGFHTRAGSSRVIEIHGDLHRLHCTACTWKNEVQDYAELTLPPSCPDCGALVRPAVVLFGEMLPVAAVGMLQRELARGFDLVVSVGTTSAFPYIADPVIRARHHRVPTVEINPGESEVSHLVDHRIQAGAAEMLSALLSGLESD